MPFARGEKKVYTEIRLIQEIICYFKGPGKRGHMRTHCCPWCFLGCANWETFVAETKCSWTKLETFSVPGHKNKCCARGQMGKHLCWQQCVRNIVGSFARALRFIVSLCHFRCHQKYSEPHILENLLTHRCEKFWLSRDRPYAGTLKTKRVAPLA